MKQPPVQLYGAVETAVDMPLNKDSATVTTISAVVGAAAATMLDRSNRTMSVIL
jgi:hypothetical protein